MSTPVPLRLRPLEIGDILDETFRLYRRNFLVLAGIAVIFQIPLAALSGFGYFQFLSFLTSEATASGQPDFNGFLGSMSPLAAGVLVNLAVLPLLYGGIAYAVCQAALGNRVTIWSALRGTFRKYFQVLGFYFLLGLMIVAFCLFPLWAWIAVNWVVVLPIMFIEGTGLFAAMGRSWRLVQGRWWRTFFILFLMYVLNYVISLGLGAFLYLAQVLMTIFLSPYLALAIYEGAVVLVSALVIPVQLIAVVLIYFDLRVRKEAIDLFQLAHQTTVAPPSLA